MKHKAVIVSQKTPIRWNQEMKETTLSESIVSRASTNNFELVLKGKSLRTNLSFNDDVTGNAEQPEIITAAETARK